MDNPIFKQVWITKYALTEGVFAAKDAKHCVSINESMISLENNRCFHKPDWHLTEKEAVARVIEMAKARLASLDESREKIEALLANAQVGLIKIIKDSST